MKDRIVMKTNVLLCGLIVAAFLLNAIFGHYTHFQNELGHMEDVCELSSEGIYQRVQGTLEEPIHISKAMASDTFLRDMLKQEAADQTDESTKQLGAYLNRYYEQFAFDSFFVVSCATLRYYYYGGLNHTLTPDDPEDSWYYQFLQSDATCEVNVDHDEVPGAEEEITVFVNCKVLDDAGAVLGVVGAGVRLGSLQMMLAEYREEFGVDACLVGADGLVHVSAVHSSFSGTPLSQLWTVSDDITAQALSWTDGDEGFGTWQDTEHYLVSRYMKLMGWHLLARQDISATRAQLIAHLIGASLVSVLVAVLIALLVWRLVLRFNQRIVELSVAAEQERHSVFERATAKLFEEINEVDVDNDALVNESAHAFFERAGAPKGASYSDSLRVIARSQIEPHYRESYLATLLPQNLRRVYEAGEDVVRFECPVCTQKGRAYEWMRIIARVVPTQSDGSLRLLLYRQNIDAEKRMEADIRKKAHIDVMTGLLNREGSQRECDRVLAEAGEKPYAMALFDIDNFKQANDGFGHLFGDHVLSEVADGLRAYFGEGLTAGRIGGDEYVVLYPIKDEAEAMLRASELRSLLNHDVSWEGNRWRLSVSIGVAIYPKHGEDRPELYRCADIALYSAKARGKNSCALYTKEAEDHVS